MAAALPSNQVQPKNHTLTATSGAVPQSKIKLTENEKHHAVVGIALTTVLIPPLRKYVDTKEEHGLDGTTQNSSSSSIFSMDREQLTQARF